MQQLLVHAIEMMLGNINHCALAANLAAGDVSGPGASGYVPNWRGLERQEGMAILNECVLALAEDNNYGLSGFGASRLSVVQLQACLPAVYEGMQVSRLSVNVDMIIFFGKYRWWSS